MPSNKFANMIAKTVKLDKKAKPCRWFAFKLRLMLYRKAWQLYWRRKMVGASKFKVASAGALITLLTVGGGVGVYAYSSPDVTVMHPLYPLKQSIESTEVYLAPSARLKAEIQLANSRRRINEMRRIGMIMARNENREALEVGMRRTMLIARKQINESLAYAAEEDSINEAEEMMATMRQHLREIDNSLDEIVRAQMLNERAAIRNNMQELRQYAQIKLKKINQVSVQISSPMRIKGPRAIMRALVDDGHEIEQIEMVVPDGSPVQRAIPKQKMSVPTGAQLQFN